MKNHRIIEICANSAFSCREAAAGGAARVELCAGIPEGGTTPSLGEIKTAQRVAPSIDINVIIRPRGGDFLYTSFEIESMLYDIEMCRSLGVHGVVFGCLTRDGSLDIPLMKTLKDAAGDLSEGHGGQGASGDRRGLHRGGGGVPGGHQPQRLL